MMKKIFLLVAFFVLGKMWSYAQYPITQNIGSDSTIVVSKGALQSRLINVTYPDTATANLQRIRQYPGAQIATTSGGINLWIRNATATAWLPINTGSGNNIYTIDGTLTGNRTLTGNNYSLTFTGLSQFLLTVGNQTFTVRSDSASLTRKLSYASNRGSTFTLYSLVDKNYVDSAIASSPAGTVTQINTNNNTGITGGPITSTGTLAIDTLLISTRAWRQKGVDSLQANINLKLNIVDTTGMLANYVNSVGYGLGKTSQTVYVDSASLSNYYLRRKDSLTATNPLGYVTQKILADTAAAIRSSDLGGTVTSVATNNGTGITGGTITTSGTLAIDTTVISTRDWRQKGVDSLQANINLKLNISDTASMLNPYLRKVDTASLSNRINQKLNISDTASMLSPYLRSNTAAATYVPQTRTLTINGTTQDLSANRTYNVGTVTSVGLTMPAAFNVANSPVTGSGTLAVTGAGLASQYIRGDGTLANFPGGGGGGGASVSYYLNGSVNQGTFGGNTYYQMNKTPVLGAGTNFTINANGYIAQFITNAGDPALLNIPAGNWNFELFFSASSGGGTPSYYVELYKYDGATFTLIASGSSNPDVIVNSAVDAYFSALPVPQTTLTLTDRLAVRIYVTHAGRTITLHTEDNNLCQVVTTFTTGITALNNLTAQVQYLTTGTSGTDFNISSLTDTHTFNLPVASGINTGKLSNTDWTTFNNKVGGTLLNGYLTKATGTNTIDTSQLFQSSGLIGIGTTSPTQKLQVSGNAYVNGQLFAGDTALSVYQVEGILNTPYVLGRKAVNNTLSTEARPTGVMGHVVGRGSIANRLQAANFYTTTDSASTANSTGSLRSVNAWTAHNGSGSLTTAWGSYNIVQNKTTGTITNAYGSVSGVENRGATSTINKLHGTTTEIWNNYGGTIDTAFGQVISIYNNNAASNIGAVYGLSIGKGLISASGGTHYWRNSGTIGTSYGLYLDSSIDVGTTKYALFSNSNSNSYFRAKLGIGTTSPDSAFQVATGAYFQRGIRASGLPQAAGTKALRIDASGTISYADTLIDAGGTVTSVATNNGTGITGGTITTSGTLAIDTLLISTRAWRQKGVDSLQANINLKLNISDTASMLSPYLRKADTTAMLNPYFRLAGVGLKNTGQTVYADTLLLSTRAWRQKGIDSVAALANTKISGSLISGYIPKATGTLTVDTSQIYQNNGNIGIGTISPASGFKVDMTGSLRVGNGSSYNNITINGNSGAGSYLRFQKNGTNKGDIGPYSAVLGGTPPYSGSNDDLTYSSVGGHFFNTNAGIKMYLTNAGNLGLSASPDSMLTVLEGAYFQRGVRMSGLPSAPGTRALRINANGTLSVADTLVDAGGTVTSVATNNGTGITGGTITTTGTLAIDTLRISTRAWRQKGIDSVAALINSNVSGTTNYVAKFTGTNTIGNSQLFDNGTNVGIGTTSPGSKLQVNSVAGNYGIVNTNGTVSVGTYIEASNSYASFGTSSNHPLGFFTNNNAPQMYITTAGNVGIGTTSPGTRLVVQQSADNAIGFSVTNPTGRASVFGYSSTFQLDIGSSTNDNIRYGNFGVGSGVLSFLNNGSEAMRITSGGDLLVGTTSGTSRIQAVGKANEWVADLQASTTPGQSYGLVIRAGTSSGDFPFYVLSADNSTAFMAIKGNGNVGIGTTSPTVSGLTVSRTGDSYVRVQGGSATYTGLDLLQGVDGVGYLWNRDNTAILFGTNNTERMRLTAGGNLLVGTTTDAGYKLDVNGTGRFSASYSASGSVAIETWQRIGGAVSADITYNDANTSMNFGTNTPHSLNLKTNNNTALTITSGGNVGIGTTSPQANLVVQNASGTSIPSLGSQGGHFQLQNGTYGLLAGVAGSGNVWMQAQRTDGTATAYNLLLQPNGGNVGIGTTSPSYKLEVNLGAGNSGIIARFNAPSYDEVNISAGLSNWIGTNSTSSFSLRSNNTDRLTVHGTTGNVLIGTTTDAGYKLDVNGSGRFNGVLTVVNPSNPAAGTIEFGTSVYKGILDYSASTGLWNFNNQSAGPSTTNYFQFQADGTPIITMRQNGNVGIGTISPVSILNLYSSLPILRWQNPTSGTSVSDGGDIYLQDSDFWIRNIESGILGFATSGVERMRITSGGNVLVGTTTDVSGVGKFVINYGSDANWGIILNNTYTATSNNGYFQRFYNNGTEIGTFYAGNAAGSLFSIVGKDGLSFATNGVPVGTERMRIATTGAVRFNAYGSGSFTGTRAYDLSVDASGNIIEVPVGAGTITGSGTTNYIPKFTSSSAIGNSIVQDYGDNVWVGSNTAGYGTLNIQRFVSAPYATLTLTDQATPSNEVGIYLRANGSNPVGISSAGAPIAFYTGGPAVNERMRLDASGNLGLGRTPAFRLDVQTSAVSGGVDYVRFQNGASNAAGNAIAILLGDASDNKAEIRATTVDLNNGYLGFYTQGSGSRTEKMRLDASGNLGLGVTPSAWQTFKAIQINGGNSFVGAANQAEIWTNSYFDGGFKYYGTGLATRFASIDGQFQWFQAASGTAGNSVPFTQAMTLFSTGNLAVGGTSDNGYRLNVTGNGYFSGAAPSLVINTTNTSGGALIFQGTGTYNGNSFALFATGSGNGAGANKFAIYDNTNNAHRLVIDNAGNVGIGTTSPTSYSGYTTLNINNSTNGGVIDLLNNGTRVATFFNNATDVVLGSVTSVPVLLYTGNTERMRVTSGGEVLIGSTGIYGGGSTNESDLLVVGAPPSTDVDRGLVSFMDNRAYNTSGLGAKLMLGGTFTSGGAITFFGGLAGLKENTTDGNYAGALAFYTRPNGAGANERMRITSGGNLLVGTTTDSGYKLDVNGTTRTTSFLADYATIGTNVIGDPVYLRVQNYNTGGYPSSLALSLYGYATSSYFDMLRIQASYPGYGRANFIVKSQSNSSEVIAMTIQGDGNVGIGTTSPNQRLTVGVAQTANTVMPVLKLTTTGTYSSGGSSGAGASVEFGQYHDTYPNWVLGQISGIRSGASWDGALLFYTNNGSAETNKTEQMRITSGGNVGIGTPTPAYKLDVLGSFSFTTGGNYLQYNSGVLYHGNYYQFPSANDYALFARTSGALIFGANDTERMRITSGGDLGIGSTTGDPFSRGYTRMLGISTTTASGSTAIEINGGSGGYGQIDFGAGGIRTASISASANETQWGSVTAIPAIIYTNSAERMRITSGGNVLVGTTTDAGYKLDVNGSIKAVGSFNGFQSGTQNLLIDWSAESQVTTLTATNLFFGTNAERRMTITSGGNVGIGTSSPSGLLHLSNTNPQLFITNTQGGSSYYMTVSPSIGFNIYESGVASWFTIRNGGNVGIGTTSPPSKLTVTGNIESMYTTSSPTVNYLKLGTYGDGSWGSYVGTFSNYASTLDTDLRFGVSQGGTATEVMRITSGGNVGIGTTSPTSYTGYTTLALNNATNGGLIDLLSNGTRVGTIYATGTSEFGIGSISSTPFTFLTGGSERMRITSGGSLLVGTTSNPYSLGALVVNHNSSLTRTYFQRGVDLIEFIPSDGTAPNQISSSFTSSGSAYKPLSLSARQNNADLYLATSGNVGIGTTSPVSILNLYSSLPILRWQNPTSGTGVSDGGDIYLQDSDFWIRNIESGILGFATSGVERMRITSGGNVLVGTTTDAGYKFDVAGSLRNTTSAYFATSSGSVGIGTTSPDASTKLQVESSSSSSLRVVSSAASGGDLYITSVNGSGESKIDKQGAAGPLTFYNNGSERMRLTSSGELLINTTTDAGAYYLQVNGDVYASAYYESSDLRLKNVLSERKGSDGINTIAFKWKDGRDSLTHIGYAAQQVEKVLPDAVKTNPNGYKTINYDEVQSLKIANLEQEIAELKKIIKQLIDKK